MAMGTLVKGNATQVFYPCTTLTPKTQVVTVVSNAEATAATATELKNPTSFAGSNCAWLKLGPNVSKVAFRNVYAADVTTVTAPAIRVYGAFSDGTDPNPQFATDGSVKIVRLDGTNAASSITLTSTVATDLLDSTYKYGDWTKFTNVVSGVASDVSGVTHLLVLVSSAAAKTGGAGTINSFVEAMLIA